jgi:hypothetical protein
MSLSFTFDTAGMRTQLNKLKAKRVEDIQFALAQVAIQMLTWMNTGSPNEPLKPPIRFGTLRGSGSAFVGKKLIGVAPPEGEATPATSYAGPEGTITIIYNTSYAAKMHEWQGGWGPYTTQDGSAGAKWIEKHLAADGLLAMEGIAEILKERAK